MPFKGAPGGVQLAEVGGVLEVLINCRIFNCRKDEFVVNRSLLELSGKCVNVLCVFAGNWGGRGEEVETLKNRNNDV